MLDMLDMLDTHMPLADTEPMDTHTPMDTMERDLLMLSPRLRLMLMPTTMVDMPMELTPMPMEPTLMELTHTDMDMPGESKLIQRNLRTNNKNQKLTANII